MVFRIQHEPNVSLVEQVGKGAVRERLANERGTLVERGKHDIKRAWSRCRDG